MAKPLDMFKFAAGKNDYEWTPMPEKKAFTINSVVNSY